MEKIKKKLKIGFLGPKGTFSHRAALEIFSEEYKFFLFSTIGEIFEAVNSKKINFGVVPAENTLGGIVSETINKLIKYPLKVTGSFNITIHHCLLARIKDKNRLKIIKSHEQALSQCRDWLEDNLPKVKLESTSSTTAPILENKSKDIGFIASSIAAQEYNLNILAKNIEANNDNITKFYIISKGINGKIKKKLNSKRTLILFAVKDRVGILRDILDIFAKNNLNLTSLHSIPSRLRPWDYFFFTEVQIPIASQKLKKVQKNLKKYCTMIRVIGAS
jgi:chorismate mutase/prephenate dehydratase